jgi:cell division protease FtsH
MEPISHNLIRYLLVIRLQFYFLDNLNILINFRLKFDNSFLEIKNILLDLKLIISSIFINIKIFFFQNPINYIKNQYNSLENFININPAKTQVRININTGIKLSDIVGMEKAKQEVKEIVGFFEDQEKYLTFFKNPTGVLLVGKSGTGKTLLAKAIAGEAGIPFFNISSSEFTEIFVGIGASRIRELFNQAASFAPCIIFIDEIDAIGKKRGRVDAITNDENEQVLNQILAEMDGFKQNSGIIVVAATNKVDTLDSALLRPGRFDKQIVFNIPNKLERLEILKFHAKKIKFANSVNLKKIAERASGFVGADLVNLLNEAAMYTLRQKKHLINDYALNWSYEQLILGDEKIQSNNRKILNLIGYYEVGHAITGTILKEHTKLYKITIVPRGNYQSFTWFMLPKNQLRSRNLLFSLMLKKLGGRAAEYTIFGEEESTTKSMNDLQQVTNLASRIVTIYGMSNIGPISLKYSKRQKPPFYEGIYIISSNKNEEIPLSNRIDNQIYNIINHCSKQAVEIIRDNRPVIDILFNTLLTKNEISGLEFRTIIRKYTTFSWKFSNNKSSFLNNK